MRVLLTFCLMTGCVSTLVAESKQSLKESDLARNYYSAYQSQNYDAAEGVVQDLQKRFPEDPLTKLVSDHWSKVQNRTGISNWNELRLNRKNRQAAEEQDETLVTTHLYQVADLLIPPVLQGTKKEESKRNATALFELLQNALKSESTTEVNSELIYLPQNLSLIVRTTPKRHRQIKKILGQIRRIQDIQVTYEVKMLTIPAENGDIFASKEILTKEQLQARLQKLTANEDAARTNSLHKVTAFNDATVYLETDFAHLELHGRVSEDRRAIAIETRLSRDVEEVRPHWIFETSDLIPDGKTGVYFIKTSGAPSKLLDHRKLTEQGVELGPTVAPQFFLMVTPRIIIQEEEEELISNIEAETGQTLQAASPPHTAAHQAAYYSSHPTKKGGFWTPAKLEWDDGNWNLDFQPYQANQYGGQTLPWYWPAYPVQKTPSAP